jgi:hypothetical protein
MRRRRGAAWIRQPCKRSDGGKVLESQAPIATDASGGLRRLPVSLGPVGEPKDLVDVDLEPTCPDQSETGAVWCNGVPFGWRLREAVHR